MLKKTIANLGRLRRITAVVARHGLGHYLERWRWREHSGAALHEKAPDAAVAGVAGDTSQTGSPESIPASAYRFRAILEDLGSTFIKFGQVLSTRADLLPRGFAQALTGLQDSCPPMLPQEVQRVVEMGLQRPLAQLFREFDVQPVASASIAQVHRAITPAGDEVAVKVQRLGVREEVLKDLDILGYLALLAERIIEEGGMVTPRGVVEEFEGALLAELDFRQEARMLERFQNNMSGRQRSYVVPQVFPELSCETVLTMEFIHGTRLAHLGPQHDAKRVASNVVHAAFEQLFVDGLFHADPHPGNIFVLDDNRLALLDFGCVGQISYAMRETLVVLVLSIGMRDADAVARLLYRVATPGARVELHRLRDACASLFDVYLRDRTTLANVAATALLRELFELAASFKLRVPSEYALVARASVTTEGIIRQLDPQLEVLQMATPFLHRLVEEQFTLPQLTDATLKNVLRARGLLREAPMIAAQILMDLEAGKLRLQFENNQLEQIARGLQSLGMTLFAGLVAGGLVTGSLVVLAVRGTQSWGFTLLPLAGLLVAMALFAANLGRYVLLARVKKISLSRWLGKRRRRA